MILTKQQFEAIVNATVALEHEKRILRDLMVSHRKQDNFILKRQLAKREESLQTLREMIEGGKEQC